MPFRVGICVNLNAFQTTYWVLWINVFIYLYSLNLSDFAVDGRPDLDLPETVCIVIVTA